VLRKCGEHHGPTAAENGEKSIAVLRLSSASLPRLVPLSRSSDRRDAFACPDERNEQEKASTDRMPRDDGCSFPRRSGRAQPPLAFRFDCPRPPSFWRGALPLIPAFSTRTRSWLDAGGVRIRIGMAPARWTLESKTAGK